MRKQFYWKTKNQDKAEEKTQLDMDERLRYINILQNLQVTFEVRISSMIFLLPTMRLKPYSQNNKWFLAAQSSSRSHSVRPSAVCPSVMFVKKWHLDYQQVIKTYLPAYLWDISDSSNICDSHDSSDSSDSSHSSET